MFIYNTDHGIIQWIEYDYILSAVTKFPILQQFLGEWFGLVQQPVTPSLLPVSTQDTAKST